MEKEQLKNLVEKMSLNEKIDQLLQVSGYYFEEDGVVTGPMNQAGFTQQEVNYAGSVLGIAGAEKLIRIQKEYIKKQPHHIPLLFMADIINGFRTIFPIPLAQGCSFDPEVARTGADIAAKESAVSGLHLTFSPMVDLVRDPRWGRVMESTGEDTYLNSVFAKAMVEGYQGTKGLKEAGKIAACVKHFAGYGAPVAGREYNTVELSTRTLYDNYLPAYKAAIDAGCATAMASFNTLDRVPSTANKWLLRDVLRKEMGFEGALISDWAAIEEIINHGLANGKKEAAKLAMEAGVDIDMMTTCYCRNISALIEEKQLNISLLDEAVLRILNLKNDLGLFENPYKDADAILEKKMILCENHREKARWAAAETMVLLKNENNILPLKKQGQKIAFIGPHVNNPWIMGVWSIFGRPTDVVTLEQGVKNAGIQEVSFSKGAPILTSMDTLEMNPAVRKEIEQDQEMAKAYLRAAVKEAQKADTVVLALGEHPTQSGEATSRTNLHLEEAQLKLFYEVSKVNSNIVVVLLNGRPIVIDEIMDKAKAVLEAWLPGTEGGNAICDILFGDVNPSAKLSMSFPIREGQIPVYYSAFSTGRPAYQKKEKYLSQYIDCPNEPLFAFGYGRSYTTFSISDVRLNQTTMTKEQCIEASVTVKNEGTVDGSEVIQLYIRDKVACVSRPLRELKGFQKIYFKSNEEKIVTFTITEEMLRFHDIHMNYISEPGDFQVYIGNESTTQNEATFTLETK